MVLSITSTIIFLVAALFVKLVYNLYHNWKSAHHSGCPYTVVPLHLLRPLGFALGPFATRLFKHLPEAIREPWLSLIDFRRLWNSGRDPFERMGSESFIAVSPFGNVLWTCDPDAFIQATKFCSNPTGMKGAWEIYGPSIPVAQGNEWRTFRKTIAPAFSEENHAKVWSVALKEVQLMVSRWSNDNVNSRTVLELQPDAADLMLHIASETLYGRKCQWDVAKSDHQVAKHAHRPMDYDSAIKGLVQNLYLVFLMPRILLKHTFSTTFRNAYAVFEDWGWHMRHLRDDRKEQLISGNKSLPNDLLGALVTAQIDNKITADAVTGNMLFTLVAAHETSANALCFALAAMAAMPLMQTELQTELDRVLPSDDPSDWSYRRECVTLLDGYAGAIILEALRLWTALPAFIKVNQGPAQQMTLKNGVFIIEHGMEVLLHATAAHNNRTYWPKPEKSSVHGEGLPFPLSDFHPTRWFRENPQSSLIAANGEDISWIDEMNPDRQAKRRLVSIRKGIFAPFSEGPTACLGSRMAMVELVASLAYICKKWRVRAAVQRIPESKGPSIEAEEAQSRARLIDQITGQVAFNLVVQTAIPISLELVQRR